MQLILKNTGSNNRLDNWLKGFKDVDPSLLLEIDLTEKKFVAKGFPETRVIVKCTELSFEEAGYELSELLNNEGESLLTKTKKLSSKVATEFTGDNRIKVGIYNIVGKLIEVINLYAGAEHTLTVSFDTCKNVKYVKASTTIEQWQAERMTFKSMSLIMNVNCSQLSEFFYFLRDDIFNNVVCNLDTPAEFVTTTETIANLHKISNLFTSDKQTDTIKFYTKMKDDHIALYALDNRENHYDYLVGFLKDPNAPITSGAEVTVGRENFIKATRGLTGEIGLTVSQVSGSRLLVTAGTTKIIVASMQNA